MFGKKKHLTNECAILTPPPTVLEVVRKIKPVELDNLIELKHKSRIDEVSNKRLALSMPTNIINELLENNFQWFIPVEFVELFNYHATLLSPDSHNPCLRIGSFWSADYPEYKGDIPDTILTKLETAKNIGLKAMTIHSMYPMPVNFVGFDPVVIGWARHPWLEFHPTLERDYIKPKLASWRESIGVIVAVWDIDKEIELVIKQ